jgi:hypothetical protein
MQYNIARNNDDLVAGDEKKSKGPYQSWKHRMQSVWAQSGSTTLRFTSRQIPHSRSLSVSTSESSWAFLNLLRQSLLCFFSSSSVIPLGSCSSDGNMTPAYPDSVPSEPNGNARYGQETTKSKGRSLAPSTVKFPDTGHPLPVRQRRGAVRVHLLQHKEARN